MKKCIIILIMLFTFHTNAQKIKFESKVIDYGKIKIGSDGTRFFRFKNVGYLPLNIKRATSPSGCHYAAAPKKPIFPEETGVIKVHYDTSRSGFFSKPVFVHSNAKNKPRVVLTIKGMVID